MDKERLARRIAVAAHREPADLVITNGKIIDVFNGEMIEGDVAIADGYIAGIGKFLGLETIDAKGAYIAPGFIDGHVHIESSMVTPQEFAKILLLHGVTTVITDPHEIANVAGVEGIQFMIDSSEGLPLDIFFMMPSSVPAVAFEQSGAVLNMEELKPFYQYSRVLGLAEVMNFPAVRDGERTMLEKLYQTSLAKKKIDGHAAGLHEDDINIYMSAGIRTDHECTTIEEAKIRLQKGMYLMIREGTVAKDLRNLIGVVNERNAHRCLFVTDDKHIDDLLDEGSIDHNIKLAIQSGLNPITAIQMATINAAECFGLYDKGAVAPGYQADLLFIENLEEMTLTQVFKDGKLIMHNHSLINFTEQDLQIPKALGQSVSFHDLSEGELQISINGRQANMIGIIPNSLVTHHLVEEVIVDGKGLFQPSIERDQLKLVVIERHHLTKQVGLGIVKGLGLKEGAIASTVAHDSHNLIIGGTNNSDILLAAQTIKAIQGGLVVVRNGQVLASLELPIAGLLSPLPYKEVYKKLQSLNTALKDIGASDAFNPFLTLSFLALPVIPELKLTSQGLFNVPEFKHINIDTMK